MSIYKKPNYLNIELKDLSEYVKSKIDEYKIPYEKESILENLHVHECTDFETITSAIYVSSYIKEGCSCYGGFDIILDKNKFILEDVRYEINRLNFLQRVKRAISEINNTLKNEDLNINISEWISISEKNSLKFLDVKEKDGFIKL